MSVEAPIASDDVESDPDFDAAVAADPGATAPGGGTGASHGAFPWGLVAAPFLFVGLALALRWNVKRRDLGFSEERSLDWESKIFPQIQEHLSLTGWSTLWVLLIAIPLGIALTRPALRKFSGFLLTFANSGQALPAYGLFVIIYFWRGFGTEAAIISLVIFTLLPVLRNTMVGLDQVNEEIIESAKGMGLTKFQILRKVELPLSVPVILAGVRTALVINVGMAALAVFVGGGGLGVTINSGLKLSNEIVTFTGAGAAALLALTVDWAAAVIERVLRPRGL